MSVPPVDDQLLGDATEIAAAAAAFTLGFFRRADLAVEHKADGSEVTDADRGAEALVRDEVARRHPHDTVIGEEAGVTEGTSGRRWIVDPIDGTASFVRGVPLYSSLLAVLDEHGPAVGIIAIPALGHLLVAGRGRGCHLDGRPVGVSTTDRVDASCISSSSFDRGWWPDDALLAITGSGAKTRTWGDGYGYLLVATGAIEAMIDPELNRWDVAPMLTIIPEAGGRLTTWQGDDGVDTLADAHRRAGWVASNGAIHDDLLGLVAGTRS